jgi:hypothetical protein
VTKVRLWLTLAGVLALAAALWWAYNAVYDRGAQSVQAQWDKERASLQAQSAKAAADALATTKQLAQAMDKQRSNTHAQISALNASLGAAVAGLRERPGRDNAGGVPVDTVTGARTGATGADLLRQDGEFLAREAARADRLRLELVQCQDAYSAAREAVNKP